MSGVTARRGFAFQDLLLADRVLEYVTRARACDIDGSPRPAEPLFGVEASGTASDEGGPEWDLLEQHPEGNVWLEEVKRGQMDADDRKALWLRVRAQVHQLAADERQRLLLRLVVNSEKPPHVLTGWQELADWVAPANVESVSRLLQSPTRPARVRDAADLTQEAIYFLTCTSVSESPPLDIQSTLRVLQTFELELRPASELAQRIERRLSELTDDLAIDTLLDCLRGAISRRAEGVAAERVFRPSELLAGLDVLQHLMRVEQQDARLWRDLQGWSRASQASPEDVNSCLAYVDWRRVQPNVSSALDIESPTALLGRGGLGKSTTLRHFLDDLSASQDSSFCVLRLDATQLASCAVPEGGSTADACSPEVARLTGALALGAFATKIRGKQLVIAVDAIEALDDRRSILSVLSSLLAAVGRGVHVVVTCRATTWNELRSSQPAVRGWRVVELTDWPVEVVAEVIRARCSEAPQQPGLALLELLRTPLFLDLFLRVTRGASGSTLRTSSRLELLAAYWQQRILPNSDPRSLSRADLLREVSQGTMEGIEHHRRPVKAGSEEALRELASEGLFTIAGGSFDFRHALLRDFALAQSAAETASPLRRLCSIQSHFVRLGALELWLEAEISVKGGVARLRSEFEELRPGAQVDVASSLGQLGNADGLALLELTTGMQTDSAQQLMAHATRWAGLAGNSSWLIALGTLPAHAAWAERTAWLDSELIQQLLDLVQAATANNLAPSATRGLAEAIRAWVDAPKFAQAPADHGDWLQGHAISIIGRASPTDDTLRWLIQRGKPAGAARTMITGTLPDLVTRARGRLNPALVVEACLVGAGLRWIGRRLAWDDKDRQDWRGLRPYLLGEGMRWPGWLETHPEEFVPVAVAFLAGLEWNELEDFGKRREPEIAAFLAELEEASPSAEPSDLELATRDLARGWGTPFGDEPDVVPQLMKSVWQPPPLGPLALIEWFRERASSSLSGDGRFFDDVLWPAVRDGASLACRIAVLEVLALCKGRSPRPEALTTLLMQPALYRCPDAHTHLQRAIRLQWHALSSSAREQLLDCIMFSTRRHGFETPDVYAPGPLLAALPEKSRPAQLEPYLELYREAALSLELEARRPVTSRSSVRRPPRTRRVLGLAPPARESWKRLLALPDATIRSSTPEHESLTLAALRAVLSHLPAARDLVKVEGAARRLHDVVYHLVDERAPHAWPMTTTEIENLLSWALDELEAFSEQELGEGCSALEGGTAQLPPKAQVWVLLASTADKLLRALPIDDARRRKFFEVLDERLKSPPDSIALWIFFHIVTDPPTPSIGPSASVPGPGRDAAPDVTAPGW